MIEASYIDHLGSDDRVVDAARVSFAKQSAKFTAKQNDRLLSYLARNNHWSPFAHAALTVHVRAPIFVARQLQKHQVGLAWNEVSRRYVDDPPSFYAPDIWRGRAADKKQGSSDLAVLSLDIGDGEIASPGLLVEDLYRTASETYDALIKGGVAPEQARMVLPQATFTEWYWTGSLAAWARVCALRCAPDAQAETSEVAWRIDAIASAKFPRSWTALFGAQLSQVEEVA